MAGTACGNGSAERPSTSQTERTDTPVDATSSFHGDQAGGFSLSYPGSWSEQEPATGLIVVAVFAPESTIDEGFRPNINVVVEPLNVDMDSEAYADANISLVSGSFEGFEELDRGTTTIDREPAIWIEYTALFQDQTVKQRQAYFTRGRNGFVITYSATEDSFEDQLSAASLVEASFSLDR